MRNARYYFHTDNPIDAEFWLYIPAVSTGAAPKHYSEHECKVGVKGAQRISSEAEFKTQVAFYFIHCFLLSKKL